MVCEFMTKCGFMERAKKYEPFAVKMLELSYCEKNKYDCAIYRRYEEDPGKEVPDDLWPN